MHIHYYGSDILRKRCKEVQLFDHDLVAICEEMKVLMDQSAGVALAAPQVGKELRIFVGRMKCEEGMSFEEWKKAPIEVFINPQVTITSDLPEKGEEGCVSIPGIWAEVVRPKAIHVRAQDVKGRFFEREYEGRLARIVLHENDHLNGVLFFDRLPTKEKRKFKERLRKLQKEDPCYKNSHLD